MAKLETLCEKRLAANKIWSSTAKNVERIRQTCSASFMPKGDLVLIVRSPMIISKKKGKLEKSWEGPFVVEKAFSGTAYHLTTVEGARIITPTNALFLKKYL